MISPIVRTWDSDELYLEDQDGDSSWSHSTAWGENAAMKFMAYGDTLKERGWFYHDDTVADFGGNDGFAAHQFYLRHGVKPIVIDCAANRLEFAAASYGLVTVQCFLEDIQLPDKSIDWGFCSHTMEHTRDPELALAEIARVVKRACAFIVPLEKPENAKENRAHCVGCPTVDGWKKLMHRDWIVKGSARTLGREEAQIFARPRSKT
jgi:ubiquinone/menaquinone biosynthesis C-methylase UbiE